MAKKIVVNKFGGGIMVKQYISYIVRELRRQLRAHEQPVVVVSAFKGVTDEILVFLKELSTGGEASVSTVIGNFVDRLRSKNIDMMDEVKMLSEQKQKTTNRINEILGALEKDLNAYATDSGSIKLQAKITSCGERLSAVFIAGYLESEHLPAQAFLAEDIPIITDDHYLDADIIYDESANNLRARVGVAKDIPVIAGFTGRTNKGEVTVLGRGGTDTTACFVGAALDAKKIILWKDVGGVLSADPKIVKQARTIHSLGYDEVEEAGKIIHQKAIRYIEKFKTPTDIAAIVKPSVRTAIVPPGKKKIGAKIVSYRQNLTLFSLAQGEKRGYEKMFEVGKIFSAHKMNIVLMWNTPDRWQVVAENSAGLSDLKRYFLDHLVELSSVAVDMVTLVGHFGWREASEFNRVLYRLDPSTLVGAYPYPDCIRLEGIVKTQNLPKIIRTLHSKFI